MFFGIVIVIPLTGGMLLSNQNVKPLDSVSPESAWTHHPPVNDVRDLISYKISRFAAANDRLGHLLVSNPFDIRLNQWRVLALIHCLEPVTFGDIASELQMDKGQLSRIGVIQVMAVMTPRMSGLCKITQRLFVRAK